MEIETLEDEYADALSDVPNDAEDIEDSDSDERLDEEDPFQQTSHFNQRVFRTSSSDEEESEESCHLEWSDADPPRVLEHFHESTGARINLGDSNEVENVVNCFFGDDLFDHIAVETNRYREQNHEKYKTTDKTLKWRDVSPIELRKFFGLVIIMGLVKKPRINDYWSTHPVIETAIFSKIMSRNRFKQILRYLHFSNNERMPKNADRLCKVQHLIDYFCKKFHDNFAPGRNISICERLIPWHGGLSFRVHNRGKMTKYGLLVRMVCDAFTGYILRFKIYSNAWHDLETNETDLLDNYTGKWHHLYIDNLYKGVDLANRLILKRIRLCGTISKLPESLEKVKLKSMQTKYVRHGEILLQVYKTNEWRDVKMISTIHNADRVETGRKDRSTGKPILKPKCIVAYNKSTKGADRADKILNHYPFYGKTTKWTKKVAFYSMNCTLFNSFRVYESLNVGQKVNYYDFLTRVANAWVQIDNGDVASTSRILEGEMKHQLVKISETKKVRRSCRVCYATKKIRKSSCFMCKSCKAPLHMGDCFNYYHTKKQY